MVSPYLLRPLRSLPEVRRQRDSPPAVGAAEGVGASDRNPGADPAGDGMPDTDLEPTPGRPE